MNNYKWDTDYVSYLKNFYCDVFSAPKDNWIQYVWLKNRIIANIIDIIPPQIFFNIVIWFKKWETDWQESVWAKIFSYENWELIELRDWQKIVYPLLILIIFMNPILLIINLILIYFTKTHQWLHNYLTKTLVIDTKNSTNFDIKKEKNIDNNYFSIQENFQNNNKDNAFTIIETKSKNNTIFNDHFSQKYDNKNNDISIFQKLFIGSLLLISLSIVLFQLAPKNQKENIYNLLQEVRIEIIWVNFNNNGSINDIFLKNCPYLSWQDYCKNYIVNNYFKENEFEKLYDYCQWKANMWKTYCLENTSHFKNIEQKRMLFMNQKNKFNEGDKQIINEVNSLINNF